MTRDQRHDHLGVHASSSSRSAHINAWTDRHAATDRDSDTADADSPGHQFWRRWRRNIVRRRIVLPRDSADRDAHPCAFADDIARRFQRRGQHRRFNWYGLRRRRIHG